MYTNAATRITLTHLALPVPVVPKTQKGVRADQVETWLGTPGTHQTEYQMSHVLEVSLAKSYHFSFRH